MAGETLQDEVRSFLTQHIRSVVQLETLLLLRLDRQRVWSATELSRELRIDPGWAVEELARLCELGLLECDELEGEPRYRFQPATEDLDRAVGSVAQAYLTRRVSVIEAIYSKSAASIRVFADAFRIRQEEGDG